MNANDEIKSLLNKIFMFEPEFKAQILDKLKAGVDENRLNKLKDALSRALDWQTELVERKIKEDKNLVRKLSAHGKKIGHEILEDRARTLRENDFKKMQTILLKIKSI